MGNSIEAVKELSKHMSNLLSKLEYLGSGSLIKDSCKSLAKSAADKTVKTSIGLFSLGLKISYWYCAYTCIVGLIMVTVGEYKEGKKWIVKNTALYFLIRLVAFTVKSII